MDRHPPGDRRLAPPLTRRPPSGTARTLDLPGASRRAFRLDGSAWEYPSFDNAEALVARLARAGLLVRDPAVSAALAGDRQALTRRSVQRHFLLATGMTHRT